MHCNNNNNTTNKQRSPPTEHHLDNKEITRWNFTDIMHSFMVVFRALCGEWVESMYDFILVSGDKSSIVYFVALAFIGSFLVSYYFVIIFFFVLLSHFHFTFHVSILDFELVPAVPHCALAVFVFRPFKTCHILASTNKLQIFFHYI